MTVEDIIADYYDETTENEACNAYADMLYQEALRITMELNNQHHTPDEIREIMSRLTGRQVDDTFRLFPPFYTDFGKNTHIGRDVFINSGCHFQDQGGIEIGDGAMLGHNVVLSTTICLQGRNGRTITHLSKSALMCGSVPMRWFSPECPSVSGQL